MTIVPGWSIGGFIPSPTPATRDLGAKLIAEQGVQRVWRAASVQSSINTVSSVSCPDLANIGSALVGAGAVDGSNQSSNISNHPGIMIGQQNTAPGKDRSMRLARWQAFSTVYSNTPTIPQSGSGVSLNVDTVNGFTSPSGSAIYAPGNANQQTINYTSITTPSFPGTLASLNGCTCPAGAFTPNTDTFIISSGTRTQYDPRMQASGTFNFSNKSFVVTTVVRPADMLRKGIGGSGTGDESGTRRSLCVFSAVASGAGSNPGSGQAIYCMIDPDNSNAGLTGHVRFGWDSSHEIVLSDAIRLGRAHIIICQYDSDSGNATIWVGQRGATDVVSTSGNIGAPSNIGNTATFSVGYVSLNNTLYSFQGYWGISGIHFPSSAWTTTIARSMWVEAGLDTQNNFGGSLPFTATIGTPWNDVIQTSSVVPDTASTWRGTTRVQQAPKDFAGLMGNAANFPAYSTVDYSNPLYIVDETVPEVELTLHPDGNQQDMVMAFQQGVPIPPAAVPALGTDSSIVIWRPSTDEVWDLWSCMPPFYHTGQTQTNINGRGLGNGRWNAGFGGWQTDVARLRSHFDGGSSYFSGGGWGGSATKIPYWFAGGTINELLNGALTSTVHMAGAIAFTPQTPLLSTSTSAGGGSMSGIPASATFAALPGDTITVDDTTGHPRFGASDLNAGLVTSTITLPTGSFTLPVDNTVSSNNTTYSSASSGTVTVYTNSGPVSLTYSSRTGTSFSVTAGGNGQTVAAGAPWAVYRSSSEWNVLKVGTDYFTYGLLVGNTYQYVLNVSNSTNNGVNSGNPPPASSNTTIGSAAGVTVTRVAASDTPVNLPHIEDGYTWPANNTDGYHNTGQIVQEGNVFRFPQSINFDQALTGYSFRTWNRSAGTLDSFTKMLCKAIQKYGLVVRDKSGSIPIYLEDPWEYMKVHGMNPYTGGAIAFQAAGSPSGTTLPLVSTSGMANPPNSGSGVNTNDNYPASKAYVPARGCTFIFNNRTTSPAAITNAIGDANFSNIQAGDWIMVQCTSNWITEKAWGSLPSGYTSMFPNGLPSGVPIWPSGISPGLRVIPWDLLELVDPTSLKTALGQ